MGGYWGAMPDHDTSGAPRHLSKLISNSKEAQLILRRVYTETQRRGELLQPLPHGGWGMFASHPNSPLPVTCINFSFN